MADNYIDLPVEGGGGGGGTGTVTSVGLAAPAIFSVSGSPVTTSGNITLGLATETANKIWAGPTTGVPATPTFRSLVAADIPTSNLTAAGTDGIVITGGTASVIGSGTSIAQHVADSTHNGYLLSTDWVTFNGKQAAGNYITALTGDISASGPGSAASTLATVNANTGSFGSSTAIPNFTVNGKGLITAAGTNVVIAPAGTVTGTTLASNVVTSSLTAVGTIVTGVWNGTATMGSSFITSGTTISQPANTTSNTQYKFTLIGGGGAGAGTSSTVNARGAGGGAGGTAIVLLAGSALSGNWPVSIAIGSAGAGSSGAGGGNGGNTTLTNGGTTYTAAAGTGGTGGQTQAGGAGGTTTNATIGITGQAGGSCGGGSLSAGIIVGQGGGSMYGLGGAIQVGPATGGNNGINGTGFGAGGSGGATGVATGAATAGGNGSQGCILMEWGN